MKSKRILQFSDWRHKPGELDEMIAEIHRGGMPPIQYWIFHPSAKMNAQQKLELINALETSIGDKAAFGLGTLR
jgi:hypothetical protein